MLSVALHMRYTNEFRRRKCPRRITHGRLRHTWVSWAVRLHPPVHCRHLLAIVLHFRHHVTFVLHFPHYVTFVPLRRLEFVEIRQPAVAKSTSELRDIQPNILYHLHIGAHYKWPSPPISDRESNIQHIRFVNRNGCSTSSLSTMAVCIVEKSLAGMTTTSGWMTGSL